LPLLLSPLFPYTTLFRSFLKSFPVPFPRLCLLRLRFLQVFFVHVLFLLFSLKTRTQTFGYAPGSTAQILSSGLKVCSPFAALEIDRKSTRLNSSHVSISY